MAVYNGANTVGATVKSIQAQSYRAWTMIGVDDASTDGTDELLERFARDDTRISVIRNKSNRGLAASLNEGVRRTSSDLIARIDADDVCLPNRFAEQVRFLEEHPEISVLGTGAELLDEHGRSIGEVFRPEHHEALVERIYRENPFIHPSVMVRRSFYEALGGYDERLRRSQDYDLWLRGYKQFRYHNLHSALIRYRVHRSLSLMSIVFGTFVLSRAASRERLLLTHGWYAGRFAIATLLTKMGLRKARWR
jgi:glycosyltransferase involved in cell wall biosynthesis